MLRPGALIMKQDRESPLQLQQAPAHCQLSCLSHDQDLFATMHDAAKVC